MNITVIGRGNVGGGLAARWRAVGHVVEELGRDGGDASVAGVLLWRCRGRRSRRRSARCAGSRER